MRKTRATVLMPVYNAERFLRSAMDSILRQTFTDFEFLIFDDGSTDSSPDIVRACNDPRIRFYRSKQNVGYVKHLNRGIDLARGEYIFRMDADDIARPDRFARQIAFMDAHPDVGACGSWVHYFGNKNAISKRPAEHEDIILQMLSGTTLVHPSVVMRTGVLREHGLYYAEDYLYTEDYLMWIQLSKVSRLANIPEVLLHYRIHDQNVSCLHFERQMHLVNQLRTAQFEALLDRPLTPGERDWVTFQADFNQPFDFQQLQALVKELRLVNRQKQAFDPHKLEEYLHARVAHLYNHQNIHSTLRHSWNTLLLCVHFPKTIGSIRYKLVKTVSKIPLRATRRLGHMARKALYTPTPPTPAPPPMPPLVKRHSMVPQKTLG